MRVRPLFLALAASFLLQHCPALICHAQTKSPLSANSARNLIRRLAGGELPSSAVRVRRVTSPDGRVVEAFAEIETAFRLVKEQGGWRVAEIRTGDRRWEEMALITEALNLEAMTSPCAETNLAATPAEANLSVSLARCLLAELTGAPSPSDAVRVRSVAPFALPFGDAPSAMVEARLSVNFRLARGADRKWRVVEIGTADGRRWIDVEMLLARLNERKRARALAELEMMATALEAFRRERGFYVEAQTESALVDHLNPRYLRRIIRLDPWHKPYQYEGTRNAYTLRSDGADGRPNTADDIVKTNAATPQRTTMNKRKRFFIHRCALRRSSFFLDASSPWVLGFKSSL